MRGFGELRCLDDVGVDDVREVVNQQIFSALTVELRKAKSIGRTDDRLRTDRISHTETRREIQLRHIDESAVIDASRFGLNERSGGRAVV